MFFHIGGVIMKKLEWEPTTPEDNQMIVTQLGREPRGVLGVAKRCVYEFPQVIVNRPIIMEVEDISVFPTLFWLTCPYLKRVVGQLESKAAINELQQRIAEDPEFASEVEKNHLTYAELRKGLIPDDVLKALAKNYPNRLEAIVDTGVGGIRSRDGVKCLHTHLADYLAREDNIIGKMVYEELGCQVNCESGNCELEL